MPNRLPKGACYHCVKDAGRVEIMNGGRNQRKARGVNLHNDAARRRNHGGGAGRHRGSVPRAA